MSRHRSRKERWVALLPTRHRSIEGMIVSYFRGEWWAEIRYRLAAAERSPEGLVVWHSHFDRLGPFKRPRNAMVEAERHATMLRNRHGERIWFDGQDQP